MNRIAVIVASVWVVVGFSVAGVGTVGATPTDSAGGQATGIVDSGTLLSQTNNTTVENTTTPTPGNTTNETDTDTETADGDGSVTPGAQLAGVIGVQQAEVRGEVTNRAFGLSLAAANSNGSKAQLVTQNTEQLRDRLQDLENETAALNESYQDGNISTGTYHARMAHLTAQIQMTERLVNQTAAAAEILPDESRAAHGVNLTLLEELRTEAHNMTGQEVSAIAKMIGGPQVGHPLGKERGRPEGGPGQGPPGESGQNGGPDNPGSQGQGPPGDANYSSSPMNNSTMGHSGQQGQGNGHAGGNGGQNQSADAVGSQTSMGDIMTFVRSLFAAPW